MSDGRCGVLQHVPADFCSAVVLLVDDAVPVDDSYDAGMTLLHDLFGADQQPGILDPLTCRLLDALVLGGLPVADLGDLDPQSGT